MEQKYQWEGEQVCTFCHGRLSGERYGVSTATGQAVQPIEKTGKPFKAAMLLGGFIAAVGTVVLVASETIDGKASGGLIVLAGLLVFIAARVLAWWYHG